LGVGWRAARSCILAGATLIPFSAMDARLAVHGLDSGFYAAAVATAVFLFRIYPLYALHFMSLAVSNEAGRCLDSNVYMYWM
jgi:hypothetical protein